MPIFNALIIAAHPDDEVLGCGGTMAKLAATGTSVHTAFLADGVSSRAPDVGIDHAELGRRRAAAIDACQILGVHPPQFADFPDNRMDTVPLLSICQAVEKLIDKVKPELVITHHAGDVNIDHQRIHQAVVTACRPQADHPVKILLFFEIPSSTEWQTPGSAPIFAPNWFEDVSPFLELKLQAMAAYDEELRMWPHSRSLRGIRALANWRGAMTGVEAAEAFMLGRKLG